MIQSPREGSAFLPSTHRYMYPPHSHAATTEWLYNSAPRERRVRYKSPVSLALGAFSVPCYIYTRCTLTQAPFCQILSMIGVSLGAFLVPWYMYPLYSHAATVLSLIGDSLSAPAFSHYLISQSFNLVTLTPRVAQFSQPPRAPMPRFLDMKRCSLLILTLWLVIPLSAPAKMLRWLITGDLCCRDNGCSHTVCFASQIFADGLLQYDWWASLVK